jgi:hypothetical protein
MMLHMCISLLSFICMHTSLEVFNFFLLKIFEVKTFLLLVNASYVCSYIVIYMHPYIIGWLFILF